jgi:iron complex outermembrane receptor protein
VLTGGLGAVVPPYPLTRASLKTTAPRVALNYDIADHASVYATYATGFRAGFGNLSSAVGHHATTIGTLDIPADVRNETVANYEVGAKGLFLDGRLSVNAAAFYMDYKDLQVRAGLVTDANQPGLAFNLNAGKAYARGFELETAARPLDGLELRFDVGYVDTKILNLNNVALTSTDIPAVRPWTTDTTAIYEFPLPRGLTARLRADYVWQAHTYVSLVRNPGTEFPKFGVANLQATIENDRWSATAYIDNAFSKAYWFVTGADGTLSGDIGQFIPRTFGVRFTIKE